MKTASLALPKSRVPFPIGYQSKPEPTRIREIPISLGGFAELFWQHGREIRHTSTPEGRADLAAWVARRPELANNLDLNNPVHARLAEKERLNNILVKVRDGRGWPTGGKILLSGSGWPCGFRSRPRLGKVAKAEIRWLAEVAGLGLLWEKHPNGWQALLALPGFAIPEFTNLATIFRDAGLDTAGVAGF